jgi:hypothetical protein
MDLVTHDGVCGLATEGRRPVDLGTKVTNSSAPHRICGVQHTNLVIQLNIDGEWVWSTIGGGIRRRWRHPVGIGGSKP